MPWNLKHQLIKMLKLAIAKLGLNLTGDGVCEKIFL